MKKIVFALQVFAAITIIPVYAVLEMNHKAVTTTKASVIENTEAFPSGLDSSIAIFPIAAPAFSRAALKDTQKCSNDNCTYKNCQCGSSCTCKDY